MKKWLYILVGLLCCLCEVQAQEFRIFEGKVLQAGTNEAIPFATVSLAGSNIATITNRQGGFSLKIPVEMSDSVLVVSHIGYRTRRIPPVFFKPHAKNVILLEQATLILPEVLVKQAEAEQLMREVIRRIPQNYPQEQNQMAGFYREMIRRNKAYVSVAEAILEIYKAPYHRAQTDQAKIYKGRRSIDLAKMDTIFIKYQGGVQTALLLDLAKNYMDVLSVDFTLYYDFFCESYTAWDDRPQYILSFDQKKEVGDPMFRGRFYIDADSYAITKAEFNMNVEGRKEATAVFLKKKPAGVKMEVEEASYVIQYRRQKDKWYYQYAKAEVRFKCKWPQRWFHSNYTIQSEFAVTDRSAENAIRFPRKERLAPDDVIIERIADFQDPDFWEDYNIIEPEQSIENAIRRLARKLKRRK